MKAGGEMQVAVTGPQAVSMLDNTHPLIALDKIINSLPATQLEFRFLAYSYKDGDYADEKNYEWHEEACFNGLEITSRCYELDQFFKKAAEKGRDVVVCSDVTVGGAEGWHIPLIDFACNPKYNEIGRRDDIKCPLRFKELVFFNSGRSMHAYGIELLKTDDWVKFMGRCLLMNFQDFEIADTRWIGWCLDRGFSALRLSCQNEKYKQLPQLMENPFQNVAEAA